MVFIFYEIPYFHNYVFCYNFLNFSYSTSGSTFVRLFALLHWGIFEESVQNSPIYSQFYKDSEDQEQINQCPQVRFLSLIVIVNG